MEVKKIAFFECDQQRKEFFQRRLAGFELLFFSENLSEQHLPELKDCQIIAVVNYSPITREIVDQLPETKLIAVGCTGYNNVDVKACEEKGILVSNTPGYSDDAVAEHTLTLMLMLLRHAHIAHLRAKDNNFSWNGIIGNNLKGKTLGIIGTGKIGLKVIELAKGFGVEIVACSRNPKPDKAAELGFRYAPLPEVLAGSDIVSLHLTANKDTYHFINHEKLNMFKKGSLLINTSRGEVLDSKALIGALDNGILKGAALDVLEEEKVCQENCLLQSDITLEKLEKYALNQHLLHRPDVLITPHIGWYTEEAIQDMFNIHLNNMLSFMKGAPDNLVIGCGAKS